MGSEMCIRDSNKASSRLGYIRRTIPPFLQHMRAKAYTSLVRPILEYSASVWDGSLTATQSTSIEAVQRRAARAVYNIPRTDHKTSTSGLLEQLDWQPLECRRERRRVGLFRAMHFGEVATDVREFIDPHPHPASTRRHSQQYFIPDLLHESDSVHGRLIGRGFLKIVDSGIRIRLLAR